MERVKSCRNAVVLRVMNLLIGEKSKAAAPSRGLCLSHVFSGWVVKEESAAVTMTQLIKNVYGAMIESRRSIVVPLRTQ